MEQTFPMYINEYRTISNIFQFKECDCCYSSLFIIFDKQADPCYIEISCYICNRSIDSYDDDNWTKKELIKVNRQYLINTINI